MKKTIEKVFINAPIFAIENNNKAIFESLQSEIWFWNVEAVAPSLSMSDAKFQDKEAVMKSLASKMIACDLVVTHGNWFDFEECQALVNIARLLNIEVVHYSRMNERLSNKYC